MKYRLISLALICAACGDDDGRGAPTDLGPTPADAQPGDPGPLVDASSDPGPLPDASSPPDAPEPAPVDCGSTRPASTNAAGILTAYPSQTWSVIPSHLRVTSVNFVVTEDGDERGPLLEMFGEIRNDGSLECNILPDVFLDGEEVVTITETPPYQDEFSSVTADCLGTGEVAVFAGVARGIDEDDLEGAFVSFDGSPNTFSTPVRSAQPTIEAPSVAMVEGGGYGLTGTLRPHATIYNYALRVYPKDARGLIVDELLDFPNSLETLPAGSSWPIETGGTDCAFTDYLDFQGWIDGARSGFLPGDSGPEPEHLRLRRERRMRIARLRDLP
jgi:hypothetical protein